jgi:hypothetical protein
MFEREKAAWEQVSYGIKRGVDTWWNWNEIERKREAYTAAIRKRDAMRHAALAKLEGTPYDIACRFIDDPTSVPPEAFTDAIAVLDKEDQVRLVKWALRDTNATVAGRLITSPAFQRWAMENASLMAAYKDGYLRY